MAKTFAAFPLNLVCFPGEKQNLHIFEQRYRSLIKDCLKNEMTFIIVPIVEGKPYHLGTEMNLEHVDKMYADGKSDVTVKAVQLMKISRLTQTMGDKAYPGVQGIKISWNMDSDIEKCKLLHGLIIELYSALNIDNVKIPTAEELTCAKVVHKLGLSFEQELKVLGIETEKGRIEYLIGHLKAFIPTVNLAENLKIMAALNGHYKNISPEKLF
ncbi:LON peptidase substrate-binding domain-containing protein [Saprospiraceae bacterium]|nr:LON peptidase substrate-binding domain-containing protein [Saprospiraceae bacterium]